MRYSARKALLVVAVSGALTSVAAAQTLATLPPNNGSGGVFMDLTPTSALNLDAFGTYFGATVGAPVQVEVWTRPGSYVGNTTSNVGWTLTQTVSGVSAGTTTEAQVNLTTPILLPAGQTTAVYLHSITTSQGIRYQGSGTTSTSTFSNSDLTLFSDVARTGTAAFGGSQFTPRAFAGTLYYSPADPNATGACCFTDGTCQVLTVANCVAQNGAFKGANVACAAANCPQPAACCLLNGTCVTVLEADCVSQGGVFQGVGSTCASSNCDPGSIVYAVDIRAVNNRLLTFGVNLPNQNVVAQSATVFDGFAMDFNEDATVLYGITNPGNAFGTIDQSTGNFNSLGFIGGAGSIETNWAGLSFDPTTDTWYAVSSAGAGLGNLYTIDMTSGNATLVAPLMGAGTELFIDIAIDANGNMFTHDIVTDSIYSVNKATGQTALIGPTGYNANFAQGMDFDWATGKLYAAIYTGGGTGVFAEINTATGAATPIVDTTPWNAEMEMAIKAGLGAPQCYANCDGSTGSPVLNTADFGCFLTKFAAGDPYANCDGSTGNPTLNVADFGCFLAKFAAGCN